MLVSCRTAFPVPAAVCGDLFHPAANQSMLNDYGAICLHFGQALTDLMQRNGQKPVPIGLMDVSWGGTMIEHWSTNATTATCKNTSQGKMNGMLYNGMVGPFANMSIKGWLWYQGGKFIIF